MYTLEIVLNTSRTYQQYIQNTFDVLKCNHIPTCGTHFYTRTHTKHLNCVRQVFKVELYRQNVFWMCTTDVQQNTLNTQSSLIIFWIECLFKIIILNRRIIILKRYLVTFNMNESCVLQNLQCSGFSIHVGYHRTLIQDTLTV